MSYNIKRYEPNNKLNNFEIGTIITNMRVDFKQKEQLQKNIYPIIRNDLRYNISFSTAL